MRQLEQSGQRLSVLIRRGFLPEWPGRPWPCALPRSRVTVVAAAAARRKDTHPMTEGTQLIRGLEGVVAAETKLCDLDGKNGRLAYCGYDIADLARRATFEEVAHLLWHGELPNRSQL